jgi:hypothetical protein
MEEKQNALHDMRGLIFTRWIGLEVFYTRLRLLILNLCDRLYDSMSKTELTNAE